MIALRKSRLSSALSALLGLIVLASACTVKNEASNIICSPGQSQKCFDCADQMDDPKDKRKWVGLHKCADNGKGWATKCTNCAPEGDTASPEGEQDTPPVATQKSGKPTKSAGAPPQNHPAEDAGVPPPSTAQGKPLDPLDQQVMVQPNASVVRGTCSVSYLAEGYGRCGANATSGHDFVEGCVDGKTYDFDCAYWDDQTPGAAARATCDDSGATATCDQHYIYQVDATLFGQIQNGQAAVDTSQARPCPGYWEGWGRCDGSTGAVIVCAGGRDVRVDCTHYGLTCTHTDVVVGCQ